MTKMEFAQAVAERVGGEAKEVTKTNGVKRIGVIVGDGDIRPNVYIEEMYLKGMSIEDAAEEVKCIANANANPSIDLSGIMTYESVKEKLSLRLYNAKTPAEVCQSAEEYGFDDLILVPYVEVGRDKDGMMSVKVTNQLLESWGITKAKVIEDAMQNTKASGNFKVRSMRDTFMEIMGEAADLMLPPEDDDMPQMLTITNGNKMFGALGAIICAKELTERMKNGYFIIPSSVHECIAVPRNGMDAETLAGMIKEVNETQVSPEDILGWHAYEFEGVA